MRRFFPSESDEEEFAAQLEQISSSTSSSFQSPSSDSVSSLSEKRRRGSLGTNLPQFSLPEHWCSSPDPALPVAPFYVPFCECTDAFSLAYEYRNSSSMSPPRKRRELLVSRRRRSWNLKSHELPSLLKGIEEVQNLVTYGRAVRCRFAHPAGEKMITVCVSFVCFFLVNFFFSFFNVFCLFAFFLTFMVSFFLFLCVDPFQCFSPFFFYVWLIRYMWTFQMVLIMEKVL